jgi:hypothetical protein
VSHQALLQWGQSRGRDGFPSLGRGTFLEPLATHLCPQRSHWYPVTLIWISAMIPKVHQHGRGVKEHS